MEHKASFIFLVGFGGLILMMALLGYSTYQESQQIYQRLASIHNTHRREAQALSDLRGNIYLSGIVMRDCLLDPDPAMAGYYRKRISEIRAAIDKSIAEAVLQPGDPEREALGQLRRELDTFWVSREVVLGLTPAQKAALSFSSIRPMVTGRRQAVLSLLEEVSKLNVSTLEREQQRIRASQQELRSYMGRTFIVILAIALLISAASFVRISRLEKRSDQERRRAEHAEQELRRLSHKLVRVHEEERKSISRELHDEVGQMLTALRMDLSKLESLNPGASRGFQVQAGETKGLVENTLRSVRNLAMGLRPSMLDDLGLVPALQWLARDFTRRYSLDVSLRTAGDLDNLHDNLRTCIYRVVQESLTNTARHARAGAAHIAVEQSDGEIRVAIQDDGIGFNPHAASGRGLGTVGMEERVREAGGTMTISAQPDRGTLVDVRLPLLREQG